MVNFEQPLKFATIVCMDIGVQAIPPSPPKHEYFRHSLIPMIDEELKYHIGHDIVCVMYVMYGMNRNVAIECESCCEVLLDADNPDFLHDSCDRDYREYCNVAYSLLREHVGHEIIVALNDNKELGIVCAECGKWLKIMNRPIGE